MPDQSLPKTRTAEATTDESEAAPAHEGISRRRLLGTAGATGIVLGTAVSAVCYSAGPY